MYYLLTIRLARVNVFFLAGAAGEATASTAMVLVTDLVEGVVAIGTGAITALPLLLAFATAGVLVIAALVTDVDVLLISLLDAFVGVDVDVDVLGLVLILRYRDDGLPALRETSLFTGSVDVFVFEGDAATDTATPGTTGLTGGFVFASGTVEVLLDNEVSVVTGMMDPMV